MQISQLQSAKIKIPKKAGDSRGRWTTSPGSGLVDVWALPCNGDHVFLRIQGHCRHPSGSNLLLLAAPPRAPPLGQGLAPEVRLLDGAEKSCGVVQPCKPSEVVRVRRRTGHRSRIRRARSLPQSCPRPPAVQALESSISACSSSSGQSRTGSVHPYSSS